MKVRIRKIGNGQGIILPKEILEKCLFEEEVELIVSANQLIIQSPKPKRSGWEDAFKKAVGEQEMLDEADLIQNEWDNQEWEW